MTDLAALFAACDATPRGCRTRAVLALVAAGVRRGELAHVAVADLAPVDRTVAVGARVLPMGRLYAELAPWLALRGGAGADPLFLTLHGSRFGTVVVPIAASARSLYQDLAALGVRPSALRAARLEMLAEHLPASEVRKVAGVKSAQTAKRYTRGGGET